LTQAAQSPFRGVATKLSSGRFIPAKIVNQLRFAQHQQIAAPGGGTAIARRPSGLIPRLGEFGKPIRNTFTFKGLPMLTSNNLQHFLS